MQTFALFFLSALSFALVFMSLLWLLAKRINKASIVDPAWASMIAVMAVMYGTMAEGDPVRKFLVTLMAVFWGMRLAAFIFFLRVAGKPEDPRYKELLNGWGEQRDFKLFRFYILQGIVAAVFSLPFLISSLNPRPGLSGMEVLGVLLWLAAFIGEAAADLQLEAFKADPASKGKTCRRGLWNYSRHPNYFFEFMIWCAFFVFALGSPYGIVTVICPALIFHFLFNVTGIPKAEEQALRSRGDDYRDYQQKTSKFIPWFPKK